MIRFNKPTLVTITGPTCSGKNYLRTQIENEFGWSRIVGTTTRQMRVGEIEGFDYFFISPEKSESLKSNDEFAEEITFRGIQYGILKTEMGLKMDVKIPSTLILEPSGLTQYRKICLDNNWDLFSIYVSTVESLRIDRFNQRKTKDLQKLSFDAQYMTDDEHCDKFDKLRKSYDDRYEAIITEERRWSNTNSWSAIIPGDDIEKALDMIRLGVACQNRKSEAPSVFHYNPIF